MRGVRPLSLIAIFAVAVVAGCKSSGTAPNPPTAAVPTRLYFANASNSGGSAPGSLLEFPWPFSSNVAPLVTIAPPSAHNAPFGLVLDSSHRLYVGYQDKEVSVYRLPLTTSSAPAFQISTPAGTAQALAFDGSGDLLTGTGNAVFVFPSPLSGSSSSTVTFTLPSGAGCCLQEFAVHGSTLAIADATAASDYIYIYSLPLSNASSPVAAFKTGASQFYLGVAFDANGNLYASGGNPEEIEIYNPPFTNASVPTTVISTSSLTSNPGNLAFDSSGNLYFDVSFPGALYEYSPPFTAASTPAAQTTIGLGQLTLGIVIGN
jgi:WD40 repeat protein